MRTKHYRIRRSKLNEDVYYLDRWRWFYWDSVNSASTAYRYLPRRTEEEKIAEVVEELKAYARKDAAGYMGEVLCTFKL